MTISLGILDQSTIAAGRGPDEAIRETLALARLADALGYATRPAEYDNSQSHAGSARRKCWCRHRRPTAACRVLHRGVMLPLFLPEGGRAVQGGGSHRPRGGSTWGWGGRRAANSRTAFALNPNAE